MTTLSITDYYADEIKSMSETSSKRPCRVRPANMAVNYQDYLHHVRK